MMLARFHIGGSKYVATNYFGGNFRPRLRLFLKIIRGLPQMSRGYRWCALRIDLHTNLRVQRLKRHWGRRHDLQQRARRAGRLGTLLLPILQRAEFRPISLANWLWLTCAAPQMLFTLGVLILVSLAPLTSLPAM